MPPLPSELPRHSDLPDEAECLEIHARLRRLTLRLVRDESTAEDLVQEAWLAALDEPPHRVRNLRSWLHQVVRHLAHKNRRRAERQGDVESLFAQPERIEPESLIVDQRSSFDLLWRTVQELRSPYRETLVLRFFEELPLSAIAERTGRSINTVKSQLRRGLEELRQVLDAKHEGERGAWLAALAPLLGEPPKLSEPPALPRGGSFAWPTWTAALVTGTLALVAIVSLLDRTGAALGRPSDLARPVAPEAHAEIARLDRLPLLESRPAERVVAPLKTHTVTKPVTPATRRLTVRTQDAGGVGARGFVQVWGRSRASLGEFETNEAGVLTLDIAEEDIEPPPRGPAPEGGVVVSARLPDGAWSMYHHVSLPSEGYELSVLLKGHGQTLSGIVVDESGAPIAGATVLFGSSFASRSMTMDGIVLGDQKKRRQTSPSGTFELLHADVQEHRVIVMAPGYEEVRRLVRSDEDRVELRFVLPRGSTVLGQVRHADGSPAPNARVWMADVNIEAPPATLADDMGFFELTGIPTGKARILAADDEELFTDAILEIPENDAAFWEATLGPPNTLLIRVRDERNAPVSRAFANLLLDEDPMWGEGRELNAEGAAFFAHVPGLPVHLAVKRGGAGTQPHALITIHEYGEVDVVLPELSRTTAGLHGVLLDASGMPFPSAVIVGCAPPGGLFEVRTNPKTGAFEVRVAHVDEYVLWAFVEGVGRIDLGEVSLTASNDIEFAPALAPTPERVGIDWTGHEAPTPEAPWFVETGGPCKRIDGTTILRLEEPEPTIYLTPGPYRLRAATDPNTPFESEFEVRTGEWLTVQPRLAE